MVSNLLRRLAVFAPLVAVSASADDPFHWYFYEFDVAAMAGGFSQPRFDSEGNLKIGYRGQYDLRLIEYDGTDWTRTLVDTATYGNSKIAMDLDGDGEPVFIFQNWNDVTLRSAYRKKNGDWERSTLDTLQNNGAVDYYPISIARDATGGMVMLYSKILGNGPTLSKGYFDKDKNFTKGEFLCNNCGLSGKWNDIDFDSNHKPIFAYFRHGGSQLAVTFEDDGNQVTQLVDSSDYSVSEMPGYYSNLARDTGGYFYVMSQNVSKKKIMLAHGQPGGTWSMEKIDTLLGFTYFNSQSTIAVTPAGVPYISYSQTVAADALSPQSISYSKLYLAYRKDGGWERMDVDTAGVTGECPAMTLSPEGLPVISYMSRSKGKMILAWARTTAPDADNPQYRVISPTSVRPISRFVAPRPGLRAGTYNLLGQLMPAASAGRGTPLYLLLRQPGGSAKR